MRVLRVLFLLAFCSIFVIELANTPKLYPSHCTCVCSGESQEFAKEILMLSCCNHSDGTCLAVHASCPGIDSSSLAKRPFLLRCYMSQPCLLNQVESLNSFPVSTSTTRHGTPASCNWSALQNKRRLGTGTSWCGAGTEVRPGQMHGDPVFL